MNDYVKPHCTIKNGDSRLHGNDRTTVINVIPSKEGI